MMILLCLLRISGNKKILLNCFRKEKFFRSLSQGDGVELFFFLEGLLQTPSPRRGKRIG
jgi:hypothetical protein